MSFETMFWKLDLMRTCLKHGVTYYDVNCNNLLELLIK